MKPILGFFGRVLLFCLPQTVLSFFVIRAYVQAGIFPSFATGTHVGMILILQILFFSGWALAAKRLQGVEKPWFRRLFALSCVAKGVMINGVYLASYSSYQLWSAYITWANLRAAGPHLRGFHQALGPVLFVALAAAGLVLLAYLVLALRTAARSLRWLQSIYDIGSAGIHALVLVTLTLLVTLNFWFRDPLWDQMGDRDPLIAFWTNHVSVDPVLTPDMLADRAAGAAYQVPADFRRRNVLIFVIDCLRADHLSFHGYPRETAPFLASLARAGRFQQVTLAVSNGNDSPQGIRSILHSCTPPRQNIQNFRLQDLLKRAGYRTHVIGAGDHTTLGRMREHYGPNVDLFLDGLTTSTATINDDRGVLESLDKIAPAGSEPAFFYIHLMSAHELGVRTAEFARWRPARLRMDWPSLISADTDPQVAVNSYDNGILQADHYLREIFARLEAKGYLKDYVAIIAGDHGQGLGDRGNFGHTRFLYAEDMNIPILFLESETADYGPLPFGSQVDIAPTLLDRLGLPKPARWEGQSLYQATPPADAYATGRRDNGWRAVLTRRDGEIYKYVFNDSRRNEFREELYAELADPHELRDLAKDPAYRELREAMRQKASDYFKIPVPPVQ
jgi:glucan phosphoethanolaminetransferase (alkaline phosphatase superfamily)